MNKSELLSIAKPILFNAGDVQATLEGRKIAMRLIVKFKGTKNPIWTGYIKDGLNLYNGNNEVCNEKPQYRAGDILYVRETWRIVKFKKPEKAIPDDFKEISYAYYADEKMKNSDSSKIIWRPSILMPKEASRIFLRVTDVRVERLQDMALNDFKREGIIKDCAGCPYFRDLCGDMVHLTANCKIDRTINYSVIFAEQWDSTVNKKHRGFYGWNANPWVWVIDFERLDVK